MALITVTGTAIARAQGDAATRTTYNSGFTPNDT